MDRKENRFFEALEIRTGTWQIMGQGGELCYLVEGTDRAVLIDGLTGVGSLKEFIKELTPLDTDIILTHGHFDHTGAAFEYGRCFIHPDDIALMYSEFHSSPDVRLGFVQMDTNPVKHRDPDISLADIVKTVPVITCPLYDGDVISLGGRELEAIGVPGHTFGTLVFLDRKERILFSGDACNINTLLGMPGSTSVEQYLESLQYLKSFENDYDVMYGGHGRRAVRRSIVDDAIGMCERILAGTDDAEEGMTFHGKRAYYGSRHNPDYSPACGGLANIQYRREELWKKDVSKYQPAEFINGGRSI